MVLQQMFYSSESSQVIIRWLEDYVMPVTEEEFHSETSSSKQNQR